MPTFYLDGIRYNNSYTQEQDALVNTQEMMTETVGLEPQSSLVSARVHGNPFFNSSNVIWQESPANMRGQLDVYRAMFASGTETQAYRDMFESMPNAYEWVEGIHIIDDDDPMLVEQGEAHVHKQFTDYLADGVYGPEAEEWTHILREYIGKILVNTNANGFVPAPVVVEPIRQSFGLPYEWHGAPIDD